MIVVIVVAVILIDAIAVIVVFVKGIESGKNRVWSQSLVLEKKGAEKKEKATIEDHSPKTTTRKGSRIRGRVTIFHMEISKVSSSIGARLRCASSITRGAIHY